MSVEAVGESLGRRYRIVEVIAMGGLGTVYKAVDTRLQRLVALKVRPIEPDDESKQRFLQEARVLANLGHPNIVQIYDIGEVGDLLYLAVEYVEGRTLRQIMVDSARLNLDYVIDIVVQVSIALGYAHRRGIIHRDIKPENIMVSTDGRVLVLDFGLAIAPGESTVTNAGTIVGTIAYMSPEQLRGNPVDARSDIFSLGLVFYELLTGRRAFSTETLPILIRSVIDQVPASPRSIEQTIPAAIDEIVMKLLAKAPEDRFQTIDQFLTALSAAKRLLSEEQKLSATSGDRGTSSPHESGQAHESHLAVGEPSPTSGEGNTSATPQSAPAAIRHPIVSWLVSGMVVVVLGAVALIRHSLAIATLAVMCGMVALYFLYNLHRHRSKQVQLAADVSSNAAVPPLPLIRHSTFENSEAPTVEFLPYGSSSADAPETLKIAQDLYDQYKTLFAQSRSGADIPEDVRRRLEEFDAIWDHLTTSARHD